MHSAGAAPSQASPYPSLGPARGTGAEGLWPPLGLVVLGELWPHSPSPLARTPQLPTGGQAPAPSGARSCPVPVTTRHSRGLSTLVVLCAARGPSVPPTRPPRLPGLSTRWQWRLAHPASPTPLCRPGAEMPTLPPRDGRSLSQTQRVCVLIPLDLTHEVGSSPPGRRGRGPPSRTPAGLCARPLPAPCPPPAPAGPRRLQIDSVRREPPEFPRGGLRDPKSAGELQRAPARGSVAGPAAAPRATESPDRGEDQRRTPGAELPPRGPCFCRVRPHSARPRGARPDLLRGLVCPCGWHFHWDSQGTAKVLHDPLRRWLFLPTFEKKKSMMGQVLFSSLTLKSFFSNHAAL